MNIQRFLMIFTIWCVKSSVAQNICDVPFVNNVNECNRGCNVTLVASCICSGTPSITFKDVNTTACSIEPIYFVPKGSKTYDVMLNRTFDLDQGCLSTTSLQGKIMCGQLPVQFIINIMPENEFPPWFCYLNTTPIRNPEIIVVNETLPKGGTVWDFNVCDKDKFDTTAKQVTIKSPLDGLFEINEHNNIFTLKLTTNSTLDYDHQNKYFLELQILDGIFTNVTLNLTINVMDVDNKPPAFVKQIYYMNVNEGQPKTTYVGNVHAADEDKGINATIHYQLESVNGSDLFRIDKYNGSLYSNAILDREKVDSYTLIVKACQDDNPINRFTFATVEVKINDVDDNPPVMSQKDYYATIQENAPKDSFVIQIQATDADKDEINTKHFFEIVNPDSWHAFSLNSSTGIIYVSNQSALDFETWNETTMTVRAVSTNHKNISSDNSIIHIGLTDVNDNSPQCDQHAKCTISKNAAVNSLICKVNATDADSKKNGDVLYSILRDRNELIPFAIDSKTGAITLTKNISWPYVAKYRLDVVVQDQPQLLSEKRSTVCEIFITVTDVNMFFPEIFSPSNDLTVNITEGAAPLSILLKVNASDKDPNDTLKYTIDGDKGYFEIDHRSGEIHVSKTIDREKILSYIITVSVSDRVNHTSHSTFHVNVLDINDNPPMFWNMPYSFQVFEETGHGTILRVQANDADTGENGKVYYELQNNYWTKSITINNTTGEIHVKSIDRESLNGNDLIQLLVIAKDNGSPQQSGFAWINITVKDINDHAPIFKEPNVTYERKEDFTGVLHHAQAIDYDEGSYATIRYKMRSGNRSLFNIQNNGAVFLKGPLDLDGRKSNIFTLEIEAFNDQTYTNQNLKNGIQTLVLYIMDINDNSPVFQSPVYDLKMNETLETGSLIGSVSASDADYSPEFNTVTYWIAGGNGSNFFFIDSRTGKIYLEKSVDFDPPKNQSHFSLQINASDMHKNVNGHVMNVVTTVNIQVLDQNDNIPVFLNEPTKCMLSENKNGSFNCTVKATDKDAVDHGYIKYNNADHVIPLDQTFVINPSTGEILAVKSLDFEKDLKEYTINVSAVDKADHYGYHGLTIYLQDENDEIPMFFNKPYNFSVPENEGLSTFVGRVIVRDMDKGSNLTFKLLNTTDFEINDSGEIFTKKVFDCENSSEILKHFLIVQVNDSVNTQKESVTVHILDQNDESPIFEHDVYATTISESVAVKTKVLMVNAIDKDISKQSNGFVKYKLLPADEHRVPFSIDDITGDVKVAKTLTNPYQAVYIFYVIAEDQATDPSKRRTNSCEVRINVTRSNLYPPVIHYPSSGTTVNVSEAAIVNSFLLQVNATDEDQDTITYILFDAHEDFIINNSSGVITINNILDREKIGLYNLTVQVSDHGHQQPMSTFYVKIIDINDNSPVFNQTNYAFSITEESQGLQHLGVIKASDKDEGKNQEIIYQIINENFYEQFTINPSTGELTAKKIDREIFGNKTHLVIKASDQGTPQMMNITVVEVFIQDINDNPPVFEKQSIQLKMRENIANGSFLYQLEATDLDERVNAAIEYRKIDGSSSLTVNWTGAISIVYPPSIDEAINGTLVLYVEASNTVPYANNFIKNPVQVIQISITDVNDKPPHFNQTYHFEINETQATGSSIGSIHATDPDPTPEYSMIMYWIGNGNDAFHIDRFTGEIYLIKALDVDQKDSTKSYSLEVYASDIVPLVGNQTVNQSTTVTITVKDVNDNPPVFSSDIYWCDVKEDYAGPINCTVIATDHDKMDNGKITYNVAGKGNFDIGKNGQLSLRKTLDFETLTNPKEFILVVTAEDTASHRSNATVIVRIIDVDDAAPEFLNTPYIFSVDENSKPGTMFGSVFALDVDSKNISYTLNSSASDFIIDMHGNLFAQREFDFEKQNVNPIKINVTATDKMKHANNTIISVYILNINDNSPVFQNVPYITTIDETLNNSSSAIITVSATDLDHGSISYSIIDGNTENKFHINKLTGAIQCQGQNNANPSQCHFNASIVNRYDLIVQAVDGGTSPRMNVTSVTIFVRDVNNNPPRFSSHTYWGEVRENLESVKILTVAASDIDANSTLTFKVVGNNEPGLFSFNGSDLIAHKLDAENFPSHIVHINVTDGIYQDSAVVNVTVLDVNDNYPIIMAYKNLSMPEDTKPNSLVTVVNATDADVTNNGFTYVLLHSFGHFDIDPKNGTISLISDLNFKESPSYSLTVRVYDSGTPPKSSETQIIINVNETNKHCPKFINASYIYMANENNTDTLFTVKAEDADNGPAGNVSYSIVLGNEENLFNINNYSGIIKFNMSPFYRETPYFLKVKAIDDATHPCSGTANVTISVNDVNQPPVWALDHNYTYVNNGTKKGDTILTVHAVDYDHKLEFKSITYSLKNESTFMIDNNGTVKAAIDLTQLRNYTLQVFAQDGGSLSINTTVQIEVLNIQITSENVPIQEEHDPFCFYKVTTKNANTDGKVIFKLEGQHDGFNISEEGNICTTSKLDRETREKYNLDIIAVEYKSGRKIAQIKLEVLLQDINDNIPYFMPENSLDVHENAKISSLIIPNIEARDNDSSAKITYTIVQQRQHGLFDINPNNGSIIVNGALDREQLGDTYIIEVEARDSPNKTHIIRRNFTINIVDMNDESPKFNQSRQFNISESQSINTVIGKVQAYDKDSNDEIRYKISDGNKYGTFSIDPSGDIHLVTPLDHENTTSFNLTVVAYDKANNTGNCTVRIDVMDVNDNKPEFSQPVYTANFSEGGTSIGGQVNVSATDKDSGKDGEVSFSIESGNMTGKFKIETLHNSKFSRGIITIIAPLDREDGSIQHFNNNGTAMYHLVVIGKDSGSPMLSSTAHVNIYVTDINDCPPKFAQAQYSATLSEETEIGKSIQHVTAADCDFNPNLNYSLLNAQGYFQIDDKGEITLLKPVSIDQTSINITIIAFDGVQNATAYLTINITDSNDHDPNFTQPIYRFSVPENDDDGTRALGNISIGEVKATDADKGENGNISYHILLQTPTNAFAILPNGTIVRTGVINRENVTSFTLLIGARDNGTKSRQGTCEVDVTVLDINDNSPTFNKEIYIGSVKESVNTETQVTMNFPIHAEDIDSGENGTAGIKYFLNGTGSESFRIDVTTGIIYSNKLLDRETQSQYNFTVIAIDKNGTGRNAIAHVTINILDENDCSPYFVMQSYQTQIMENANTSSSIFKVIANDLDVDGNASIQYHILSGADDKFIIDSHTGDLSVTGKLDREKKPEYTLNVTASDGLHSNYTTIVIKILDINDNCPEFYTKIVEYSITENTGPTDVGNFSAYDLDDGENGSVTVFMNDSTLNNSFSLNSDGMLRSVKKFDREKKDYYTLEIYATDHGNPPCISSIKVVIQIEDVNDNPPVFYSEDGTRNITDASSYIVDQSPVGSILLVPSVRDKDKENTNNSRVTYSFVNGHDERYFKINPTTGAVQILSRIEINTLLHLRNISTLNKTGNQTLQVLIMAHDNGEPSLNSTLLLTVFIEPINEASPGFEKEIYNFSVEENAPSGSFIGQVSAHIVNESISHLTYRNMASQDSEYIYIDSRTGNITTTHKTFDREIKNHYTFEIQVTDGRTPERTAYTTVELTIKDVNDNYPVFPQKHYEFEIPENVNTTNQVMNISATDADAGMNSKINYTLIGETDGNFKLNQSTGILEMVRTLDRESRAEYKFTITASDCGSPPKNLNTSVVVKVLDENDNSPRFYGQPYVFNISENELNVQGCKVYANDSDFGENGSVVYEMTRDGMVPFYISPLDGTLSLLTPLDYETQQQYLFQIVASDLGTKRKKTSTNVTVFVRDVYDFVPHFPDNVYEVNFNLILSNNSVLNVSAGQGNITYKLTGPNSISFDISKTTGHITLKDKLSPDVMQYIFSVVATDSITNASDSCMVIIHVIGGKVLTDYTVSVPENYSGLYPQIIYDLNSTEEQQGDVLYDLIQTDPNPTVIDNTNELFKIDNASGILYCERKLDREDQSQFVLTIRISNANAHGVHERNKRDTADQARIVKLLVIITDVNDNPPTIQRDSLLFHVFKNTKSNYIVGKVNAEDKDGDTDFRFNITGKEVEMFYIDPITGQIITLKDISSTNKMKFMLHVYVTDQDGRGLSSDANITILVIPESDRLILVANMNKLEFSKYQDILVRNMSDILGVSMFIESIEYHKEVNGGVELLDLDKSDVFIHATNKTTGEILSRDDLQRLLNKYGGALNDFFKQMKINSVHTVSWNIPHTASTMGTAEIALICLAILIGIGGIAAVCFVRCTDIDDDGKPNPKQNFEEIWELESQHGSTTRRFLAGEAINPFFSETNFNERDGVDETTHAKRRVEYETQELNMELPDEIPGNDDDERTDSGVDNESSGSERQQSECHSIVSKEESDENSPIDAIQINIQPYSDNANNDFVNLRQNKDHPESSNHSSNADKGNLNEGKLKKLFLFGSQVLLDATTGDTEDTDITLETKTKTEEEMKEKEADLSQSTSKSINDTESKVIFADDTKLENASSKDRKQSWMQENVDELIYADTTVTSL